MWQTLLNLIRLAFTFAEKMQKIDSTLKEHSQNIRDITVNQQRLQFEFLLFKERQAHEREKEKLQLEIKLLREERANVEQPGLLPPSSDKKPDGE